MERIQLGRKFYELGLELGRAGTVAIGSGGGTLARALARTAGCAAALAGGEVRFHDGTCAACGAWLADHYGFSAALFVRQEGSRVECWLQGGQEGHFTETAAAGSGPACTGEWDLLAGADCAWAACRAGEYQGELGPACAQGPAALTLALERLGYQVTARPLPGAPLFESDREGSVLRIRTGGGAVVLPGADALAGLADYVRRPQAVPAFQPGEDGRTQS